MRHQGRGRLRGDQGARRYLSASISDTAVRDRIVARYQALEPADLLGRRQSEADRDLRRKGRRDGACASTTRATPSSNISTTAACTSRRWVTMKSHAAGPDDVDRAGTARSRAVRLHGVGDGRAAQAGGRTGERNPTASSSIPRTEQPFCVLRLATEAERSAGVGDVLRRRRQCVVQLAMPACVIVHASSIRQ